MADLFGDDGEDDMLPEEEDEEEEDILDMEGDTGKHQKDSLLMRFCPHDSSMLYPQVRASFTWYCIFRTHVLLFEKEKEPVTLLITISFAVTGR
jgi:hypothetical protein